MLHRVWWPTFSMHYYLRQGTHLLPLRKIHLTCIGCKSGMVLILSPGKNPTSKTNPRSIVSNSWELRPAVVVSHFSYNIFSWDLASLQLDILINLQIHTYEIRRNTQTSCSSSAIPSTPMIPLAILVMIGMLEPSFFIICIMKSKVCSH